MTSDEFACWNVYNSNCLARKLLGRITDKWTVLIVGVLAERPTRFGELHRRVDGISKKVLTEFLRSMEADGLINRTVFPTSPPAVEYSLTASGASLINIAQTLRTWAEAHVRDITIQRGEPLPAWSKVA